MRNPFKLQTKVVKLSNGNFVPMARDRIFSPWFGIDSDLTRWHNLDHAIRYCQCVEEGDAERILERKYPPTSPLVNELKKAL